MIQLFTISAANISKLFQLYKFYYRNSIITLIVSSMTSVMATLVMVDLISNRCIIYVDIFIVYEFIFMSI